MRRQCQNPYCTKLLPERSFSDARSTRSDRKFCSNECRLFLWNLEHPRTYQPLSPPNLAPSVVDAEGKEDAA